MDLRDTERKGNYMKGCRFCSSLQPDGFFTAGAPRPLLTCIILNSAESLLNVISEFSNR